jgi:hypothetical protein
MPLQTGRDLHVDAVLSNYVIGRKPAGYIADQLVPILPVSKRSNLYYKTKFKENIQWVPNLDRMAPGAAAREVFWTVSSDTYYAEKFGLGTFWITEDEINADEALQYDQESAEMVTDRLLLSYEMRIAQIANTAANVATTTHVATSWTNVTGSRPYDDMLNEVENFRQRTTLKPNVAVIPEQVATVMRRSDQIRDLLFGDRGGIPTNEQLAVLFGVQKLLIPTCFVNTAGPGETAIGSGTLANAWPNKVLLAYVSPAPGRKVDTWVQAFRWTDPQLGQPFAIRRLPYNAKRMKQDIDAIYYQSEKVVSSDLCTVIDSVVG